MTMIRLEAPESTPWIIWAKFWTSVAWELVILEPIILFSPSLILQNRKYFFAKIWNFIILFYDLAKNNCDDFAEWGISYADGTSFVFHCFSICVFWRNLYFMILEKKNFICRWHLFCICIFFFLRLYFGKMYISRFCRRKKNHHLAVASLNPKLLAAQSFPSSQLMLLMGKLEASPGKLFSFLPNQYLNLYLYLYLYFVFTKVVSCRPGESKRALYADRSL